MEYIPLVLEGIENKVKKLGFNNRQLKQENQRLSELNASLQNNVAVLEARIAELEDIINQQKIISVLSGSDKMQARHQINELLREIDKCYSLLNR